MGKWGTTIETNWKSVWNWGNFFGSIFGQGYKIFLSGIGTSFVVLPPVMIIGFILNRLPHDPMVRIKDMYGEQFLQWCSDNFHPTGITGILTLFIFTFIYDLISIDNVSVDDGGIFGGSVFFSKDRQLRWFDVVEYQEEVDLPKYELTEKGIINKETGEFGDPFDDPETKYNLTPWMKPFSFQWFKMWTTIILIFGGIIFIWFWLITS